MSDLKVQNSSSSDIKNDLPIQSNTSKVKILKNISLTLFCAMIAIGIIFSVLFYILFSIGIQNYHKVDSVQAYEFFEGPQFSQINAIVDNTQYLNLYGSQDSAILNYIEHEANLRVIQGKPVIKKQLKQQNLPSKIQKSVKNAANSYLEMMMGPIGRGHHSWIILIKNGQQVPNHQVESIKKKYPNDIIVLVSHKQLNIQSFQKVKFPTLKLQKLKDFLKNDLSIPQKQLKVMTKKKNTLPQIFQVYKQWSQLKLKQAQQKLEAERIIQQKLKLQEQERIKKQKQQQSSNQQTSQEAEQNKSKKGNKSKKQKKNQDVKGKSVKNKKQNKDISNAAQQQKKDKNRNDQTQAVIEIKVQKKGNKKNKNIDKKANAQKSTQNTQQNEPTKQQQIKQQNISEPVAVIQIAGQQQKAIPSEEIVLQVQKSQVKKQKTSKGKKDKKQNKKNK